MVRIKNIIFDLDDTLYDCYGQRIGPAMRHAIKEMIVNGLNADLDEANSVLKQIVAKGPRNNIFRELTRFYGADESISFIGRDAYLTFESNDITPFPGVIETIKRLKQDYYVTLVTFGDEKTQKNKVRMLGFDNLFDTVVVTSKEDKEEAFLEVIDELGIKQNRTLCVGDRLDSEIRIANKLGMTTVRMLHGKYKDFKPSKELECPDYTITDINQITDILSEIKATENKLEKGPNIALIGGGTGLPTLIEGLKKYSHNISAIVTITDEGRSSGRLRKELNILPPGDIRNNLIALSGSEKLMHDLFQYRFDEGSLEGHSFGNLLIAALTKVTGNFQSAIKETSKILDLKGGVYPSTLENTRICAELEDGSILNSEQEIVVKGDMVKNFSREPIKNLFINPKTAKGNPAAIEQIINADVIVIGPGSLHTSVMPNLLIPEIAMAIKKSRAKKVYVCNIVTQPGQTDNYKASHHLRFIEKYVGQGVMDYIILNKEIPSDELIRQYAEDNSYVVENDVATINDNFRAKPLVEDILEDIKERKMLWEKLSLLRHDSNKIAEIIVSLVVNGNG